MHPIDPVRALADELESTAARPDTVVVKPELFAALQRVTHHAHQGANRAEKRAAWRRHRRYVARPAGRLVET